MSDPSKPTVEFTNLAKDTVLRFMEMQGDESLAVRVQVASPSPLDPRYEITLIEAHEKCPEDLVFNDHGFELVIAPESAKLLHGLLLQRV